MRRVFSKFMESPILTSGLFFLAFILGYMVFYTANIFANDQDSGYPTAIAIMVAVSGLWGWLAYVWFSSLERKRVAGRALGIVLGSLATAGILYCVYDVDRTLVYPALLVLPGMLFLIRKRIWMAAGCMAILMGFLLCSLTPGIRIQRYVRELRSGCWCCGYQERAVRELVHQGDKGCDALVACLDQLTKDYPNYGWNTVCAYALREMKQRPPSNLQRYTERIELLSNR